MSLTREQLLELQVMNQKAGRLMAQLEALSQRKNAISMELTIIPAKEKEVKELGDKAVQELREAYIKAKTEAGIPDGMELDIETGEATKPQQQQQ